MPLPDIIFYLDISAEEAIDRLKKQGTKGELFEKENFLEKVREGYEICQKAYANIWQKISANDDVAHVFQKIKMSWIAHYQ